MIHPSLIRLKAEGAPRYEQIATSFCLAIEAGQLRPGDRLPPVRSIAAELGVSLTTVTAAFKLLAEGGWTRGEVGRGTFVAERAAADAVSAAPAVHVSSVRRWQGASSPWRRRALMSLMSRLRSTFPDAINCSFGGPDSSLLPLRLIKRHWKSALDDVTRSDLEYNTADPVEALTKILPARMSADGIPVAGGDIVLGTSAQQFMSLAADVAGRLSTQREVVFAMEQPGYYTIFDTFDHAGIGMVGMDTDESGARPEALEAAIHAGANAVLLTPRAQNPTGASWTPERRRALGDVLSRHPHVLAIEDDHFGDVTEASVGSLLADSRVEDRVLYIRSFSKSIAPDLRLAVAAARPRVRSLLQEAKSHADGWSSRSLQRVLARVLEDKQLSPWLDRVRQTYRIRRERVASVLADCGIPGLITCPARDGVNLWIRLPAGTDAGDVIERAAELGVLVAPGEVFFLAPGHSDVLRFAIGSVGADRATVCAELLVRAIRQSGGHRPTAIHV